MSTLTAFADMSPVPRVLVDVPVEDFPAGSVTVSLQSTVEGRTMFVRGGVRKAATAPLIVLDPEPGLMVPTSYTVVGYAADGTVVGTWPIGATVVEFDGTVIQQPLDPRLSVRVARLEETAREVSRSTPGELVYPQGSVLPGLVGLGPRRGVHGLKLDVLVDSEEAADALQRTLGTYDTPQLPIWLVRTPPGQRFPRIFFCHVPELVEIPVFGARNPLSRFQATVSEVRPPAPGIAVAALTHSDMKVFFTTHSEVKAEYATHSDVKRDTSLIGAADA